MPSTPVYSPSQDVFLTADERLDLPDAVSLAIQKNTDIQNLMKLLVEPTLDGRVFFGLAPTVASGLTIAFGSAGDPATAMDPDGNIIFQASGGGLPTVVVAPNTTTWIYIYYIEVPGNSDNRRFIDETTQVETTKSVPVTIRKTFGFTSFVSGSKPPTPTVSVTDAYGNPVTRKCVLLAKVISNSVAVTTLVDCRAMFGIDKNDTGMFVVGGSGPAGILANDQVFSGGSDTIINQGAPALGTGTLVNPPLGVTGFFSLLTAIAECLSTHAGGIGGSKNWFDLSSLGSLAEVFTARGTAASLDARISKDHYPDGTHSKVIEQIGNKLPIPGSAIVTLRFIPTANPVGDSHTARESFRIADGAFIITHNAVYDPVAAKWASDVISEPASAFYIKSGVLTFYYIGSAGLNWLDESGWGTALFTVDSGGVITLGETAIVNGSFAVQGDPTNSNLGLIALGTPYNTPIGNITLPNLCPMFVPLGLNGTITLPPDSGGPNQPGMVIVLQATDSSTGNYTIQTNGTDGINNNPAGTLSLAKNGYNAIRLWWLPGTPGTWYTW